MKKNEDSYTYKYQAIQAAEDLNYGEEVINKIKKSTSDSEISRIMLTARQKKVYN